MIEYARHNPTESFVPCDDMSDCKEGAPTVRSFLMHNGAFFYPLERRRFVIIESPPTKRMTIPATLLARMAAFFQLIPA